jgi:hypothetical protein
LSGQQKVRNYNAWCELTTDAYTEGAPSRQNCSIFPQDKEHFYG